MRATCGVLTASPVRQSLKNEKRRSRLSSFSKLGRAGPETLATPNERMRYHQRERSVPSVSRNAGLSNWEMKELLSFAPVTAKLDTGEVLAPGTSTNTRACRRVLPS